MTFIKALAALFFLAGHAWAASLDVNAGYRMRGIAYTNLNLDSADKNYHSFVSQDARLGLFVRKIYLDTFRGEEMSMDVGVAFHALGVAGSTTAHQAPFNRAADLYPDSSFVPFLENAYLSLHNTFGLPVETVVGRQNFRLGGGLLLDDDGAGLTGASTAGELPWWDMKTGAFVFSGKNSQVGPNSLGLFGLTLDVPGEGHWQFSQLFETDRRMQQIYGCSYPGMPPGGCQANNTLRLFSSARYQINYGPLIFDGEVAMQRGVAHLTSLTPASPRIVSYDGNAQVLKAKWKQNLYRTGEGIARMVVARGSGDNPGTTDVDEAFFPSLGHRYSGLERAGFGDFFGATPYDALGGNYSTGTASGLKDGLSGIITVGAGFTPPAYRGIALDIDYFLFHADRVRTGSRTLGWEWDFRLRYNVRDILSIAATTALFTAGTASNVSRGNSRKYMIEVSGKF